MPYITKIEQEAVLPLAKQIAAQPSQIVSKTLVQNRAVSLTLFAFDQGEEIATHDSSGERHGADFGGHRPICGGW
mgnify:CR=1 FL=1